MSFVPDASFNVVIAGDGEILVVVSNLTLSAYSVGLGELFESTVWVFNKTQEAIIKKVGVFFGVYDPATGDFVDHFGWAGNIPAPGAPPGHSGWILPCTGVELGLWDALACVGSTSDPEHCLGFQDILSVY